MMNPPISICILSWNSGKTLKNTLASYQRNGMLDFSDDITILFQEVSEKDQSTANQYHVKFIGLKENIGIGKGITKLIENAKYETVLFLEHDWELIENKATLKSRLNSGIELLENGFDIVRYRSRKNPGHPIHSLRHKGNELNYYDDWHKAKSPHLLESLYWLDPAAEFPDKIQKQGAYFITTARWANWTNNPFLLKKEFFAKNIAKIATSSEHFERDIAEWWVKQPFKIAQGEGLFTHHDLEKYPQISILSNISKKIKTGFKKLFP
ncbi:glycosyltransferase family 2 protein [Chryseobacterium koreense]|uniref:Glycosyltransferase 2-like domain-containing protein n=1 Tax=Chryseobacterium koreense CCUG 49689 TaxID=1304281 RepID=A0A0J7J1L2_9FLAO|nr:glycosyltransferase [Chryseobacterium koreense]KMQ72132.1 hypothetical protein ACM44_03735 [Chryseobacterium koreense CCUG 49689]MBB5331979.1 glycosyltransferase involved in cell wall biosynthesis [Chryseobacterium koreense]